MPPAGDSLDDDYVIGLLKKDAESNQKRYLATGLGSLLSKRPRGNAPKPNTRFLKNIIRETDSHNAALKTKEEEESRARLRGLRRGTSSKRTREDDLDEGKHSSKRRKDGDRPGRWASALGGLRGEATRRRRDEHERDERRHDSGRKRESSTKTRHDDASRSKIHKRSRRESKDRSSSDRKEQRRRSNSTPPQPAKSNDEARNDGDTSDSDPLEDMLGPKPASQPRARGRGAGKSSNMDSRFDPSYNPKEDVSIEPQEDRDDWDMALEALRDRTKWRTQGAERLRAAGFTDEEVKKWEKGGEKDIEDVRWRKKGEGREWDRGKVVDESGDVEVKAEWGRLKGA